MQFLQRSAIGLDLCSQNEASPHIHEYSGVSRDYWAMAPLAVKCFCHRKKLENIVPICVSTWGQQKCGYIYEILNTPLPENCPFGLQTTRAVLCHHSRTLQVFLYLPTPLFKSPHFEETVQNTSVCFGLSLYLNCPRCGSDSMISNHVLWFVDHLFYFIYFLIRWWAHK